MMVKFDEIQYRFALLEEREKKFIHIAVLFVAIANNTKPLKINYIIQYQLKLLLNIFQFNYFGIFVLNSLFSYL